MPNPYVLLGGLIAVIVLVTGAFFEGEHIETVKYEAAASAAKDVVIADVQKADQVTADIGKVAAIDQQQIAQFTQTQIVEVPVYVTAKSDARCIIPRGFVRLHNAAASGVPPLPNPAGQSDDTPATVDLAAVGSTTAGNYGKDLSCQSQLTRLQDWIIGQAALGGVK